MCSSKWIWFFRSCRARGQFLLCFACVYVCLCVCSFVFIFPVFYNVLATFLIVLVVWFWFRYLLQSDLFSVFSMFILLVGGCGVMMMVVVFMLNCCCSVLYSTKFTHQKKIFAHIWIFHHGSSVFESHSILFM